MAGEEAFKVEGVVIETRSNGTYRVKLANGHTILAFATGRTKNQFAAKAGDTLKVQLSPYDLSEGRIIVETKKI